MTQNGNIYLLGLHPKCGYHEHYIKRTKYDISCTDKEEIIKIKNEGQKEENNLSKYISQPTEILIRHINCGNNLQNNTNA